MRKSARLIDSVDSMEPSNLPLPVQDLGLFTDFYELTMAQALFQQQMFAEATFSLFIRQYPPNRGFMSSTGLEDVLGYLEAFHFSQSALDYLRSTGQFGDDFLQ